MRQWAFALLHSGRSNAKEQERIRQRKTALIATVAMAARAVMAAPVTLFKVQY